MAAGSTRVECRRGRGSAGRRGRRGCSGGVAARRRTGAAVRRRPAARAVPTPSAAATAATPSTASSAGAAGHRPASLGGGRRSPSSRRPAPRVSSLARCAHSRSSPSASPVGRAASPRGSVAGEVRSSPAESAAPPHRRRHPTAPQGLGPPLPWWAGPPARTASIRSSTGVRAPDRLRRLDRRPRRPGAGAPWGSRRPERRSPLEAGVQRGPEGEHVRGRASRPPPGHLGGEVGGRAGHHAGRVSDTSPIAWAMPKSLIFAVPSGGDQHVGRLDVTVDDARTRARRPARRPPRRRSARPRGAGSGPARRASSARLREGKYCMTRQGCAVVLDDVEDGDGVRVVQARGDPGLAHRPLGRDLGLARVHARRACAGA